MDSEWKRLLYQAYVTTGQGGVGLENSFRRQRSFYSLLIRRGLPVAKSIRILDLGCGAGGLLFNLKQLGYHNVSGVDLSEEMIRIAHQSGVKEAKLGDIFNHLNSLSDNSFDVIFALDILEHFDRPDLFKLCREIRRVLLNDGTLIVHVPNAAGIFGNAVRYGDLTHELSFTQSSLRQLMRACGFSKIQCFEDRPTVHGFKSFVRAASWLLLTSFFRLLYIAETGRLRPILSQNLTAVISGDSR